MNQLRLVVRSTEQDVWVPRTITASADAFDRTAFEVGEIDKAEANALVVRYHYLHRRPSNRFSFGLFDANGETVGAVTFGTPASRHMQKSVCPGDPDCVIELNRLWVHDDCPRNSESFFVSRALKALPPLLVVSYADTVWHHTGIIYRALGFRYAGWTDMDRKTPRYDYIAPDGLHTRESFRGGTAHWTHRVRRKPKAKYWKATGGRRDRKRLEAACAWPSLSWDEWPVPSEHVFAPEAWRDAA